MSSKRDSERPPKGFLLPSGMTAAEITRQMATYSDLPVKQPPPADMPPVPLIVLDSLANGSETIYSMRNCGEMAAYGAALVGESHLLAALRSLLEDGLVEVEDEHVVITGRLYVRPLAERARTADEDLQRYWFRMTPAGQETWRQATGVLDAYRDAHPLMLADESQQPTLTATPRRGGARYRDCRCNGGTENVRTHRSSARVARATLHCGRSHNRG